MSSNGVFRPSMLWRVEVSFGRRGSVRYVMLGSGESEHGKAGTVMLITERRIYDL